MIVWSLIQLSTQLNSQNPFDNEVHNEIWHINLYRNTGISNWNVWSIDQTKMRYLLYFSSIHVDRPPNTRNTMVHKSWSEMERCE